MKIFGLEGVSGSGKSYQAISLCRKMGIGSILDDGLFISGNRILAGVSAKRQDTKIGAIKTALFTDEAHRNGVIQRIREVDPASILVLGTSEKMVLRIVDRLDLPRPQQILHIEEITTAAERRIAGLQRNEMGKHIIPAPAFQLKKEFSGYFLHPLRLFKSRQGGKTQVSDRSVVRPAFSYPGKYVISNRAISDIAAIACRDVADVKSVLKISTDQEETGVVLGVSVNMAYGVPVIGAAKTLQQHVAGRVEEMTAFNVKAVNIDVKGLK
ncbi:MAG: Asp23/Gls24 family envelope stress response protein [Clostridiales Family XIII bacterium]|jgi:hypothetical protein|nr:Asp23/Gls24 family envelope stress response protein [Clostridiales Family XIII bacterium]